MGQATTKHVPTVEVYFDLSSPWNYLGFESMLRLAARIEMNLVWKPMLLGAVFNAVNRGVYEIRREANPRKESYLRKDLADWSAFMGIPIGFPPTVFPVNSAAAMRGALVAADEGRFVPYVRSVAEAYWKHDLDISSLTLLGGIASLVEIDRDRFLAAVRSDAVKARLRNNTEELMQRGGFGGPTIFVDETDMYFGNDRIMLIERKLLGS